MVPMEFKEQNLVLLPPNGWSEEQCGKLPAHYDNGKTVSCWKVSWKDKIKILLFGRIWLVVFSMAHPPVALECDRTIFVQEDTENA